MAFRSPKESDIYKLQMNDLRDPTLSRFVPISMGLIRDADIRKSSVATEWINSYKGAAKELARKNQERCSGMIEQPSVNRKYGMPPSRYALYTYNYTLPTIFLIRHTAELAIKQAIESANGNIKNATHDLMRLWNSLLSSFPKSKVPADRKTIKEITAFLKIVSHLDDDGTKVRYAVDKNGNYTHENFEWINCIALSDATSRFVETLRSIDYEYIHCTKDLLSASK